MQLLTHHLHKRRLRRDHPTARLHAKRTRAQHVVQFLIDHLLLLQQTQDQVTTLQRQFRVTPRVVDGRPFHHTHQQRLLIEAQFFYRATKVIQARQREAADFVVAALTEIHLVHIQLKNTVFAVTRVHDQRHVGFVRFTPVRTLAGEEQVFHQLLRQRTRTLYRASGGQVCQHRTSD